MCEGKIICSFVVTACVWNYLKAYLSPVAKLIVEMRSLNSLKMFFLFAENWQKTFHNAEWSLKLFFFLPSVSTFPWHLIQYLQGFRLKLGLLLPLFALPASNSASQPCLKWYLSLLGMSSVLMQGFCQCQRMAFGFSFISAVAVQCRWTVPLCCVRVMSKPLFTNCLQSRFKMWQRLGYGWTGNYKYDCIQHVTLCHLL